MPSYYKRIQTVISHGEEDLYHFVNNQNMKNSLYIKKLIREEMLRQAGHLPSPTIDEKSKEKPKQKIDLDDGGVLF